MELRTLMVRAVETSNAVVGRVGPEMLDRPTPCPEFDVRALLEHLSEWMTARARAAALKQPVEGLSGGSSLSGAMEMPAEALGGLVFSEFLLHGWDLAAATGQKYVLDDDLAVELTGQVSSMADMGRRYGAFGPEVPVAASATPLERALGLAGRDPAWMP